jgi:hypothetical protein
MRRALSLLLLFAVAASSCSPPFDPLSKLDSLRVLAMRADPPEVRPGGATLITALLHEPLGLGTAQRRWRACLLETPFTRGLGGAGGGAEQIPSEQGPPPASCFDVEQGIDLEDLPDGVPVIIPQLPEDVEIPPQFAGFITEEELRTLGVLTGLYFTVSLEVGDGNEIIRANKRIVVKFIPPPGPGKGTLRDAEDGVAGGLESVLYGYDYEMLYLEAVMSEPAAPGSRLVRAYLPHTVYLGDGKVGRIDHSDSTREGHPATAFGRGVAIELTWDPDDPAAPASVAFADGAGGWGEPEAVVPRRDGGGVGLPLVQVAMFTPFALNPLSFLAVVVQEGRVVDAAPDARLRMIHVGRANQNPPAPQIIQRVEGNLPPVRTLRLPGGSAVDLETARDPSSNAREPYPFLTYQGELLDREETLFHAWFSDTGSVSPDETHGKEPGDLDVVFKAAEEGDGTLTVVVRDGRGGTAWTQVPIITE